MEKIEGLSLEDIAKQTEEALLLERRTTLVATLRGIYVNCELWSKEIKQGEKRLVELRDKLAKAQAKLQDIKTGNWAVVPEPQTKQDKEKADEHV